MSREDVLNELEKFARQKSRVPVARDNPGPPPVPPPPLGLSTDGPWSRSDKLFAVVAVASVSAVVISLAALATGQAVAASSRRQRARRR